MVNFLPCLLTRLDGIGLVRHRAMGRSLGKQGVQELGAARVGAVRGELLWKMELFGRLEAFCDACDTAQRAHDAHNAIRTSQVTPPSSPYSSVRGMVS